MPDEKYFDLLINNEFAKGLQQTYDLTFINDRYSVLHVPAREFNMCLLGHRPYSIFPNIFTLNSTYSLEKSSVKPFQYNPDFSLFGQGILIGFVDTGIDYQHPAFLNNDGSTRIQSIWDQTIEDGTPPENFTFGSEYSKDSINGALVDDDPLSIVPTRDDNGHGTMLAGIAAGTPDLSGDFSGVASKAELVIVKLKQAQSYNRQIFCVRDDIDCYLETDIMLGIEYLRSVALRLDRPLVICIGLGSSQGGHGGHGALSSYLNNLSTYYGIAVCISAGNEGGMNRHYQGNFEEPDYNKNFELRVDQSDPDFFLELWNHSPYRISISITTPLGENTQIVSPKFNECREFKFIYGPTTLYINNFIMEEKSGKQLILVRFKQAVSGLWKIRVTNMDKRPSAFNAWLPSGPIITTGTFFLEATADITITDPGNANNSLTVTAYNQLNDSILIDSSRGFSATRIPLPDLAAPGFQLTCPLPGRRYGSATGTGAAASHVAGIQAMIMEWAILRGNYTTITGRDIKMLLIKGAYRNNYLVYPNSIWGYGVVSVMGFFMQLAT
jgi:hypothetical protein